MLLNKRLAKRSRTSSLFSLTKKSKLIIVSYALIIIGLAGLVIAGYSYINEPRPPATSNAAKSVDAVTPPSSKKPSPASIASYSVPPNNPKYIEIPAINIANTDVLNLGLMKDGTIATPDNIYETGWYNRSSLPGQLGAMFIYGHVSSWTADGIFYNLKKLVAGDSITITTGNNKTFIYKVVASRVYPYNNVPMNQVLSPLNPKIPALNLMTCTGQVIKGTSEFNERLVVYANLVKG